MRFTVLLAAVTVATSFALPAIAQDYNCQAVDVPDDPFYQGLNTLTINWETKNVIFDHDGGAEGEGFLQFFEKAEPSVGDPSTTTLQAEEGYLLYVQTSPTSTTMASFIGDLSHVEASISTVEKGERINASYSCDAA